jgi:hypothetical protein
MVCEILFSNLYLDLIEFEINYNYNYNNSFMNKWEKEECVEVCTGEARRGITWRKIGIWRIEGVRKNNE